MNRTEELQKEIENIESHSYIDYRGKRVLPKENYNLRLLYKAELKGRLDREKEIIKILDSYVKKHKDDTYSDILYEIDEIKDMILGDIQK